MKFLNEMIEKAKTAKSVEELLAMAKAEKVELTEEQAAKRFTVRSFESLQILTICIMLSMTAKQGKKYITKAN